MPNLFDRLSAATNALLGREARAYPAPSLQTELYRSFGLPPTFKAEQTQQAYSDNPWLFSAVNVISHEVARTQFRLVRRKKDGTTEPVLAHQALETLARPQRLDSGKTMLTRYQLMFLLSQYMLLNGENFWLLDGRVRATGAPTTLSPLNPAYVYQTLNDDGTLKAYMYRFVNGSRGDLTLAAEDVVHFKLPDPKNWYRGHSPVQPIRYAVDTYKKADELNTKRLDNNAVPAGTLESDQQVSAEQRKSILDAWRQNYGGTQNAGKIAMLPNGFKFNQTQLSNQDLQFVEGKNLTRDEILANYRVGMELFGKTEGQTRANAEASVFVFQRFTVLPVLEMVADTLTNDYLPAFPKSDGLEFAFDDPVPANEENKRATAALLLDNAALTPDELRQEFGREPLKIKGVTDVPYMSYAKLPAGVESVLYMPEQEQDGGSQNKDPPKGESNTNE